MDPILEQFECKKSDYVVNFSEGNFSGYELNFKMSSFIIVSSVEKTLPWTP